MLMITYLIDGHVIPIYRRMVWYVNLLRDNKRYVFVEVKSHKPLLGPCADMR